MKSAQVDRLKPRRATTLLATGLLMTSLAGAASAQPVEIRMGAGPSSEEQVWLMKARPDLTPNQGNAYTYSMTMFRSGNEKTVALQAGQLDAVTVSTTGILFAASKGVPFVVPVSMARESTKTFSTSYLTLSKSDVSLSNLKGKTIGINGYRQSLELYARIGVAKAGLDPERDVKWLVVPLPQMGEALRQGKIDIGVFPSTFAFVALKSGEFRKVFDSAGISGIEEEFDVAFNSDFVSKHRPVVQAWADDFMAVTRYLDEHPLEARKSLVDAKIVQVDPNIYLQMTAKDDLLRTPDVVKPDPEMFKRLQEELIKAKFLETRVDIGKLVDTSFVK
jgi:ABC-type nitrate/sulfonate/bicarbonate transport system substrate-binding protein